MPSHRCPDRIDGRAPRYPAAMLIKDIPEAMTRFKVQAYNYYSNNCRRTSTAQLPANHKDGSRPRLAPVTYPAASPALRVRRSPHDCAATPPARIHWEVPRSFSIRMRTPRRGTPLKRIAGPLALLISIAPAAAGAAPARFDAEAARINNRGVAQMGQQFTDRAASSFAEAFTKDPKLVQAAINEGIALLTLQKLDEAKVYLQKGIALDSGNAQAWYNLGLAQHANNELDAALASFQQAVKDDPRDPDSYYFTGVCYGEMKQFDKAIAEFKRALAINPLHASAEFQMARALQRSGDTAAAKEHFKLFQHMTSAKIGTPIGLAYGEQGRYSTVTPVEEPEQKTRTMIPVRMTAQTLVSQAPKSIAGAPGVVGDTSTGGACMMDVAGDGNMDLVLMQSGSQAIRVLRNRGAAGFEEFEDRK